jgi:CheY-like chemotaxis protein
MVVERETWTIEAPAGGWAPPWPQCMELAAVIPSDQWTLVGGLMVQLHATAAGLPVSRATTDVDMVLHIETEATTARKMQHALRALGYEIEHSLNKDAPAHRFLRGKQQVDVMIADHTAPRNITKMAGREPFQIEGGTQALQRTVNVVITGDDGVKTQLSIPNLHGALVLKGAAFMTDSRDRGRHLDDAAVLCACIKDPYAIVEARHGSDRKRFTALFAALESPTHHGWMQLEESKRQVAHDVLRILATADKMPVLPPIGRLGDPD